MSDASADKKPQPRMITRVLASDDDATRSTEHKVLQLGDLSPDQKAVFVSIEKWVQERSDLLTLGGYAGTGKSTLVSLLAYRFPDEHIAFCAFTGKAANVLRRKLAGLMSPTHRVSTIHSLLYRTVTDQNGNISWLRRKKLDVDLIVIDEASMIDSEVFDDVASFGIPILAVGDHGQLPPINDSFSLMDSPHLRLETIHRQAEGSPILQLSARIRHDGDLPLHNEDTEAVRFISNARFPAFAEETLGGARLRLAHMKLGGHSSTRLPVILCATNRRRQFVNGIARRITFDQPGHLPQIGDEVICLKNQLPLYNGMRGWLTKIHEGRSRIRLRADVRFEDDLLEITGELCLPQFGREKTFRTWQEYMTETSTKIGSWEDVGLLFDFGYCLTVHKAQGSGFDDVVLFYERLGNVSNDEFRRWLYTGVTRASQRLTIVVD